MTYYLCLAAGFALGVLVMAMLQINCTPTVTDEVRE